MPMPHSGPRPSPVVEVWQAISSSISAAATDVPLATQIGRPLMYMLMSSGILHLALGVECARRQVRLDGNVDACPREDMDQNLRSGKRSRNAEAFMAGREV